MDPIDLKTAVGEIEQACEEFQAPSRKPFFFIVGAGISYPTIPLAAEIQKQCMDKAMKLARTSQPVGSSPLDTYSHWLEKAFPQPIQRQSYLRSLIEGKPISQANFRLAHLLTERSVTNLVVTPNFDDFISRALTLFGKPNIVCDHPRTVERINPEQDDIQIVHVHGSYWFYDCCNLRGELEQRAELSTVTTLTMASLLENILSHRSPIVIGYSGWEGDVIMKALQRHPVKTLAYKLYWACYRRDQGNQLPSWLKSHPNVQLIFPLSPQVSEAHTSTNRGSPDIDELERPRETRIAEQAIGGNQESVLSAQQVFDALIQTFGLVAPDLTRDPLTFFAKHLRASLPDDASSETTSDIYSIRSVIERVERANSRDGEAPKNLEDTEDTIEQVRNSLRRSHYKEAVQLGIRTSIANLSQSRLLEFMDAMWSAARGLDDNSEGELKAYDLVIRSADIILEAKPRNTTLRRRLSMALLFKGITLGALERSEEEIAVYDDLVKRFADATEPAVREQVATALRNKGITLGTLNRSEEAIAVYNDLVKRFADATEPAVTDIVKKTSEQLGKLRAAK